MGTASYLSFPSARSSGWQFLALVAAAALIVLSMAVDAATHPRVYRVPVIQPVAAPARVATAPTVPAITRAPANAVRPRPRGARRRRTRPS